MKLLNITILTAAIIGTVQQVNAQGFVPVSNKGPNPEPSLMNCFKGGVLLKRISNQWGETYSDTPQTCSFWASIQGWKYFGVEFGGQCWGGDANANVANHPIATNCDMPCNNFGNGNIDNSQTMCGGVGAMNIFQTLYPKYEYVGCYRDSPTRDLPYKLVDYARGDGGGNYYLNAPACAYRAQRAGYKYFALQNGGECWAGNTYGRLGASQDCAAIRCAPDAPFFNPEDKCGGPYTNAVYKLSDAEKKDSVSSFVGCYQDDNDNRDLTYRLDDRLGDLGGGLVDYQSCSFLAKKYGLKFFGLQFGNQCYGGDRVGLYNNGKPVDPSLCYMECDSKSPGENCGGVGRNQVYATTPPTISCPANYYVDAATNRCTECADNQWSDGGAIWSCYPCWGGGGSRSNNCKRIIPTSTYAATATIKGVAETGTATDDEIIPTPVDESSSSFSPNIGVIVGVSVGGAAIVMLMVAIVYLVQRRREDKNGNVQVQPQPQPPAMSTSEPQMQTTV